MHDRDASHPSVRTKPILAALVLVVSTSAVTGQATEPTPPYFTDVTDAAGLTGVAAYRISVGDLNGDGYPDVFVHLEPNHAEADVLDKQVLLLNEEGATPGERIYIDRTEGSGIRAGRDGAPSRHSDGAIFADVDNDGDLDVFTNVYLHRNYTLDEGRNDLLLNDGGARFSLAPNSPFHTQENWNTTAATFLDYDSDGALDLFLGTWYKPDSTMNADRLYRGDGAGGFADVTATSGIGAEPTCVYAVASFDGDGDGDMDLFAPPYSRTVFWSLPRHWRNNGDGTFTQVQDATNYDEYRGILGQKVSFGTIPRDFDNDGAIDFFEIMTHGDGAGATGVHSTPVRNVSGTFSWDFSRMNGRETEDPDTTHHGDHFASWFDFDGDGLADLVFTESGYGNPRLYLFKQRSDHTFDAVTVDSGLWPINDLGLEPGYVTPADFDGDGDEDLFVTTDAGLKLYRNDVGTDNGWLKIRLEGVGQPGYAARSAIGAKVEVVTGSLTQTQEVYSGNGHQGPMRPLTLHFGLAGATAADVVRVTWPNGTSTVQELLDVPGGQSIVIREPCDYASDPTGLTVDRDGDDLVLTWNDPGDGSTFNVYRDAAPDPSTWGAPHAQDIVDDDPGTPGIQYRDLGAAGDPLTYHYLVTASNVCGETPLR